MDKDDSSLKKFNSFPEFREYVLEKCYEPYKDTPIDIESVDTISDKYCNIISSISIGCEDIVEPDEQDISQKNKNIHCLVKILTKCRFLNYLRITNIDLLEVSDIDKLISAIENCKHLNTIVIGNVGNIKNKVIKEIFAKKGKNCEIEYE